MGNNKDEMQMKDMGSALKYELAGYVEQCSLSADAQIAIDRALGLDQDDVLLCEIVCLDYVEHALSLEAAPKELWIIPPSYSNNPGNDIAWSEVEGEIAERCERLAKSFGDVTPCFRGFTNVVPNCSFKQVRTAYETGIPVESALDRLEWDPAWSAIGNGEAICGVVVFERGEKLQGPGTLTEGNVILKGLTWTIELPDDLVILAFDGGSNICHMEDLSNPDDPWIRDVTPLDIAVNDGCLIPSMYRNGVELADQSTLGEIASSVRRGTSLNNKDLDIQGKARFGRAIVTAFAPVSVDYRADDNDIFYVDSSCFDKGKIWPQRLGSIPKGQERYIVNAHDGEVLLVSRNGKQFAYYKPLCPTLIANSVFFVKLDTDINKEYLECWFRSWFARSWLHDGGRTLSKGVLSSLPIPVVGKEIESLVVERDRSIDKEIQALQHRIGELEWMNRFAPLAACSDSLASSSEKE